MTPLHFFIVAEEWKKTWRGAKVSNIFHLPEGLLRLHVYHPSQGQGFLVFSAEVGAPLLFTARSKNPSPKTPSNFCRSLRKNLEGKTLQDIRFCPGERIAQLAFCGTEKVDLVLEVLPKYPNAILLDENRRMISALHYKNDVERPVLPKAPYAPPPGLENRPNFWTVPEEDLSRLPLPPPGDLASFLKMRFSGLDPELIAFLERQENPLNAWRDLRKHLLQGDFSPLIFTVTENPPGLRVLPGAAREAVRVFPSFSEAAETYFQHRATSQKQEHARQALSQRLKREIKHTRRLLQKLDEDLKEAEKAEEYRFFGQLLMTSLSDLSQGLHEAQLPDTMEVPGRTVCIPLDPALTPLQNAQRYFHKAKKGQRGVALILERKKEMQERLEALHAALQSLPAVQHLRELERLAARFFTKEATTAGRKKPAAPSPVPQPGVTRRKLGGEFELCAGSSACANEYVTFQLAGPEDLWFHVRDFPGAHVVLRRLRRGVPFPPQLIQEAAVEAARRSKAPPGRVTVSYTERKHVRKIPGAPSGLVRFKGEQSTVVEKT